MMMKGHNERYRRSFRCLVLSMPALLVGLILSSCGTLQFSIATPTGEQAQEPLGMANPASVFCEEQGGTLDIRQGAAGEYGVCLFPDGSECEEWAFFNGECNPGDSLEVAGEVPPANPTPTAAAGAVGKPEVLQVAGWLGKIASTPEGAQYDDYLVLSPEGTGEIGLQGADQSLQAEIEGLRDRTGAGEWIHVWGSLTCGVPDYSGCQLLVTRLRYGASMTQGEPVVGWTGTITSQVFNAGAGDGQGSTVFVLVGRFPMWFSIDSYDEMLKAELRALVDTGKQVTVDGELLTGIPDVNGSRILANTLELAGTSEAPLPTQDSLPGWSSYVNSDYGFRLRYPTSWAIAPGEDGMSANRLILRRSGYRLVIDFRKLEESLMIGPGGMGAGDLVRSDTIEVLGTKVEKAYLFYEGRLKMVSYSVMEAKYLQLWAGLDEESQEYAAIDLPGDVHGEVDDIMRSIEMID